jgi:transcriptional regulator with XRE-family HTH domain
LINDGGPMPAELMLRIRALKSQLGLSFPDLAQRTGSNVSTLSNLVRYADREKMNPSPPSRRLLETLADQLEREATGVAAPVAGAAGAGDTIDALGRLKQAVDDANRWAAPRGFRVTVRLECGG